ncbi:MAG: iron ABC transporter permease, partial [Clostridiales bacterium]
MTIVVALLLLIVLFFISINVGSKSVGYDNVINSIINFFKGVENADAQARRAEKVILLLRMPRTMLAILAGVGLSVSGTVMQSITRNPLVSPF